MKSNDGYMLACLGAINQENIIKRGKKLSRVAGVVE